MTSEIAVLARAHALFSGHPAEHGFAARFAESGPPATMTAGGFAEAYRAAAEVGRTVLARAAAIDGELGGILAAAARDHAEARQATGAVLAAARSDTERPDSPLAARELLRRRALRLRAQRAHLLTAGRRANRRQAALRALRYRLLSHPTGPIGDPDSRAQAAVRAALSKLGCPYVWGATGPDRFDCSGLVQWAYHQAGVPLHRTTYDQINDGVPVPRSQIRPGDLVFPHTGHVQMAIGHNLVIEAPQPGSTVQISPLGTSIAIRRPR